MLVDRSLFPIAAEWAYLDHAAVSPLATPVRDAVITQVERQFRRGLLDEPAWREEVDEARRQVAALVGATPAEIAFVTSTAQGLSLFAAGLDWQPGDNVVTTTAEYPTNVYPWLNLEARFGVTTRLVPQRPDRRIAVADLFAAVDARTRVVALSFVEFASGFRNDLATVGRRCRERGIRLVVDAIQGAGALPIDVGAMAIDFLAAGGHKWLLSPLGSGFVYCRRELLDRLWPCLVGYGSVVPTADYLDYQLRLRPNAQRFEPGSLNVTGIVGLGASIRLLREIGIERIEAHLLKLHDYLVAGLEARGYPVLSPLGAGERSAILVFGSPRIPPAELTDVLREARVKVAPRGGGIRVSPHCYSTTEDIDRLLGALP